MKFKIGYKKIFLVVLICCVKLASASEVESAELNFAPNNDMSAQNVHGFNFESKGVEIYSGTVGTGINNETVSVAGGAIEFAPAGSNYYGFFSQTLANGFYYEARLYLRDNYLSMNPIFPTVPVSNETPPMGYGSAVKIGYDFKISSRTDLIPYLRLNAYHDMSTVYKDTNGDYIKSNTFAVLPAMKIAYKVTSEFNPYIDIFGGWQQVILNGSFPAEGSPNIPDGKINQMTITYEIGFSSKLSNHIALIPYMQYITTTNNPDANASKSYADGGYNISSLTGTQQVFGLKLATSW